MRRVLAVVGTRGPFPRLVDALAQVARDTGWRVRVQYAGGALPAGLEGWALAPREVILAELAEADAVVCHAGSGTLRDALAAGHRPIVVPRLSRHGEHVDDHQLELTRALGDRIVALGDLSGAALAGALTAAIGDARRTTPVALPGDALRRALGEEIAAIARARPPRRAAILYRLLAAFSRTISR